MDGKSVRDSAAPASQAQLHKKMLQLLSSLWVTRAVGSFARLGLADIMAEGVEDHAAIAAARGLVPDRVYRLLRALSTVGVVSEPERGRFVLTPLGRLLGDETDGSMRTTAIYLNDYFADMWMHLDDALTGDKTAFEALKGRPFFDWLGAQPDEALLGGRRALQPRAAGYRRGFHPGADWYPPRAAHAGSPGPGRPPARRVRPRAYPRVDPGHGPRAQQAHPSIVVELDPIP